MLYRRLGNTGVSIPAIGQGTWKFGEKKNSEKQEIEALRFGIENGLTLIDTAEEYGNGGAEKIVGQAIQDIRNNVFLVTKVSEKNCSYKGVLMAAEASLEHLKTSHIDLYLQHWPSQQYDVSETMEAMAELVNKGLVKYVGVSNFTTQLMLEAQHCLGSIPLVCNQVAYHLNDRRIENEVFPFCKENGITVMGYSPFGYAPHVFGMNGFPEVGTKERNVLDSIGVKYGKTAYQVALNWVLRQRGIVTIPKAVNKEHILDNLHALGWDLQKDDFDQIENNFPVDINGLR
ncbi:aldo/keto reductase [Paenibacillus baekrokdamisoli]|uniref:Aldo/keto reductase n=1 Tax=Paenibacillus baekrokdamisoli TaxID=1712516 RepID=A0A3G9IZP4_9BACL|nr:aldo/keto reductase [Paenibacillus baekrokdamisoli]MBB3073418.1 diketogulonate reductase-like aldo/keto reductase [Paenibacillus baekrokdamisoli]BBH24360.1 aldo/keto reductase [Paenibacillus baekrokdamisoli]